MLLKSAAVAAPQRCKSDSYLGAWQRKGEGGQKAQVQIVFATERGASAPVGSTRGFASAPYGDGTVVASRIRQVGDSCTFDAQCGSNLSSANACKLVIDPAKNTLRVEGGPQMFVSDRVWTRTTPTPAEMTCGREDVERVWRRSDGANIIISGVHVFKNGPGGNALLFNHPEGWWPKGQTKFTGIYREGGDRSCKLKATCATYDRTASGTVVRRERACTLTIDPMKRRMTESGSSLFYTRDGAATPAKPEAAAAVPTAPSAEEQAATSSLNAQQAATAKREIAEYEAQKKRIADEQAAKEAAYRKALADREALIAENERKAREAQAKWEAAAAACRAGDRSQCAPAPQ
ncbi:cell envelope integrity protein TolA [Sphingopyxis sp. H115]|uniref:cell envelope integrity protein TolA n=1 Tax=Sphingopyxis sp. H115 TaxID=1759073 RepID=UPI00128F7784|nr:cell envelope integrity protein TolA [Sphingopyxis sp. H115]